MYHWTATISISKAVGASTVKLETVIDSKIDPSKYGKVINIHSTILYFAITGRSAWNLTWITRYKKGSMHTNLRTCIEHCENNRVQGTKFYIYERPAIVISSISENLFITQINADNPFSDYSTSALSQKPPTGRSLVNNHEDFYIKKDVPLEHLLLSFDPDSRFWKTPPPKENSLLFFYANPSISTTELNASIDLNRYISISNGARNPLGWRKEQSTIQALSAIAISKQFKE